MRSHILHDVDWGKVLEIDRQTYHCKPTKVVLDLFIKSLLKLVWRKPVLNKGNESVNFLFVKVMQRPDYDELFNQVSNTCPETKCIIDVKYQNVFFPRLLPLYIFIKYLPLVISVLDRNVFRSIYLLPLILQYLEVFCKINKSVDYKCLIVFSDMQPIESLLVQFARRSNITTVTMQHGLYIDYTDFENINTVNYKNQVAEYFLAWGNSTKDLIHQWHPETKIVICGKPLKDLPVSNSINDYFTVIFDQNLMRKYNRKMLKIAYDVNKTTGLKVNIRFHPRNNPGSYRIRKSVTCFNKAIEGSVFVIAHTTSLIHELLRLGILVYKYKSIIPSLPVPQNLIFSTSDELREIIAHTVMDADVCKDVGKEFILYTNGESLRKYREFFEMCKNLT